MRNWFLIVGSILLFNNIFFGNGAIVYESCKELKGNSPVEIKDSLVDGYYFIRLRSGIGIQVFCTGMALNSQSAPKEYLTLRSGRSVNYGEFYQYVGSTTSCTLEEVPDQEYSDAGRTEFEKLLFDPQGRSVSIDDFSFSFTIGSGKDIKYGTAGDKHTFGSQCSPFGQFSIDLTGTPWIVNSDMTWKWQGSFANGDNSQGKPTLDSKTYLGCYIDEGPRDLPELVWHHSSVTGSVCSQHCRDGGFEYAGTQYTDECYCGHSYGNFGKANETDCNMPCAGDPQEMCGGVWRNSVYSTGMSQKVYGRCGGYPGSCYPTLNYNDEQLIKLDIIPTHPCLNTPSPCYNDGVCVATDVDQFFCLCHLGYVGAYCEDVEEPLTFTSEATASSDDATAYVSCPPGMMAVECECKERFCDGAWFEGDECRVTNSGQGQTSQAVVTCLQYDPSYQRLINVESTDMHNPVAQCPDRAIMTSCMSLDFWWQQVTYGHGVVDNSTTPYTCRQDYCKTTPNGCKVQARCLLADCGCKNGGVCIHASGMCACPEGYYGSTCESFDYCAYYEDTNNAPACLNGGSCVGVPAHIVATSGGTGSNGNCQFPFVYQNMSYARCVETNEVGPPFSCAAVLDGFDSYIDLGEWNPGPVYTMEVWVRSFDPTAGGRHAIAGGFDQCKDWGIGIEGGSFKAFYDPPDDCTASIKYSAAIQPNRWYYLTKTTDGQTAKFYVDGSLVGSAAVRYMTPGSPSGFYVGGERCCGNFFSGEVKSLRVWKRALTANEIAESYLSEHLKHDSSTDNALNHGLVGYWDFGESKHPPCVGMDHMGADWSVSDGEQISGVHCNISRFLIPEFNTVHVKAWDSSDGSGKVEIYAKDINIYGVLTATGKGYRGGGEPSTERESGFQGETYSGAYPAQHTITANLGGGGGGGGEDDGTAGYGKPGGGGGYGSTGGTCKLKPDKDVTHCGEGGKVYGDDLLSTLYLGSGGGSGGNDNALQDNPHGGSGGNGGGAIRLDALRNIEIVGYVEADGGIGYGDASTSCEACPSACQDQDRCIGSGTTSCYDYSGAGGGGSGGSLYLRGQVVNVGLNHISVNGGRGGHGANVACGGDGGRGRIRIDYVEIIGKYPSYAYLKAYDAVFPDKSYIGQQEIDIANTVYGNEVYLGCFEDAKDRHMQNKIGLTDEEKLLLTPDFCVKKCREQGFKYSGTQYAIECWCDNAVGKFSRKSDAECDMTCGGDDGQLCGGNYRLTVYGPPPLSGAAVEKNGVIQECKPWCVNGGTSQSITWGECDNDGYISDYEASCECKSGFTGDDCGQTCPTNTWGEGCTATCNCIADQTQVCDHVSGVCICKNGYSGDRCQNACPSGTWGMDCMNTCSCVNSASPSTCQTTDGQCSCNAGYMGIKCDSICPEGKWGVGCTSNCNCQNGDCSSVDGTCTCYSGYSGSHCDTPCGANTWGSGCTTHCDCNGHPCNATNGICICPPSTTGFKCENGCPPDNWGDTCNNQCNCGVNSVGCDISTGKCYCSAGYMGTVCDMECPVGRFGADCAYSCACEINNIEKCNQVTGQCQCKPGYEGLQCHTTCSSGKYGVGCSMPCECEGTAECDPVSGSCDLCPTGFIGTDCQQPCTTGYYGDRCQMQCSCSANGLDFCDGVTGMCYCKPGYSGNQCQTSCDPGHWGSNCAYSCSCIQENTNSCDVSSGVCQCKAGFQGETCELQCSSSGDVCTGTGCNCLNNGICMTDFTCDCVEGFYGDKCESSCPTGKYGKDCLFDCVCTSNGVCDKANGYCDCSPGYQGSRCEYPCTQGYYGKYCAEICQCVYGSCNPASGTCLCDPGFTGDTCSLPCPQGKYGTDCSGNCLCIEQYGYCDSLTGACSCEAGFTGTDCQVPCPLNRFGENCDYMCPNCGVDAQPGCDPVSGECACNAGFTGAYCDHTCPSGYYGQNCAYQCKTSCRNGGSCDSVTGQCSCLPGYQGSDCSSVCSQGTYGPSCAAQCQCNSLQSVSCDAITGECSCKSGYTGDLCEATCPNGKYGFNCAYSCLCQSSTSVCDPVSGACTCNAGYGGSDCSSPCAPGTWGVGCAQQCLCSHFASSCDAMTGICTCVSGYTGSLCDQECPSGYWGQNCVYTCSCVNGGTCDHRNGICNCPPGYTGLNCERACDSQHFGYDCAQLCACDASFGCDPASGACLCPAGYGGSQCSEKCPSGFWGQGCINQCENYCPIAGQCDRVNGMCLCPQGLNGKYCNITCGSGKWGPDCLESCPSSCTTACDTQDGKCLCGNLGSSCKNGGTCKGGKCKCAAGYGGSSCEDFQQTPVGGGTSSGVIAAAVIVSLLLVVIIGLVVYMIYYKRSVSVSLETLKSFNPSKLFAKQDDEKKLYTQDQTVSVENPNYGFDDSTA